MMLDTLVLEIRQLPLVTRLALVEIIAESVRQELLVESATADTPNWKKGMLRPEGQLPSDKELKEDYVDYLIEKYK
jgi:hypothetical protein